MKKYIIPIILVVLINLPNAYSQTEVRLSNERLTEIYFNTLKKINSPIIDIDKIKSTDLDIYSSKNENDPKKRTITIQSYKALSVEADPYSGKIIGVNNNAVTKHWTVHEDKDKPTKNKDWAQAEAEKYLIVLFGQIPANSYLKDIKFLIGGGPDNKHSYDGGWFVWWGRKEGEYKFREDVIAVDVYEKLGFGGYTDYFFSDYHPPKNININKNQAIQIADKNINKIVRSPFFREFNRDYKIGKLDSAELIIVNPNYASIKSGDLHAFANTKPYARLAWVVKYNNIANPSSGWPDAFFGIWIDAETGEILGGDAEEKGSQSLQ